MSDVDSDVEEVEYEPEDFQFEDIRITITTIAFMPLTVLMANRTKEVEISGQKLWCGSLVVISYLLKHPELVNATPTVTIELGAGTGVVSMIAKKRGALRSIATDHDARSIQHMVDDCIRNETAVDIQKLDWFAPNFSEVDGVLADQAFADNTSSAVLLLAGDVLYKAALIEPFFATVVSLFERSRSNNNGRKVSMLLCHVPRAGVAHETIVAHAESVGLSIVAKDQSEWLQESPYVTEYSPMEDIERARLYELTWRN